MCLAALVGTAGCRLFEPTPSTSPSALPVLPGQSTGIYTTARPTFGAALDDFLNRRPVAQQPIEFPHNIHVGKDIACDVCHEGVATGPVAGIPGVSDLHDLP